jgi:hypothetical protein
MPIPVTGIGPVPLQRLACLPHDRLSRGPDVVTDLVIWFVFSARADLVPPPGR